MLFIILDQLWYLLKKLILSQGLRLWRSSILWLILINLLGLLTIRLVQAWRRGFIIATHVGGRAECRSFRRLLGLGIWGIIRVATHWSWKKVLLLHLMLNILLLLSGNGALIGGCAFDIVSTNNTWSMHRLGRDAAWLLAYLRRLRHCGGIELLLRYTSLRTSIIALLRRWRDLEALNEFLVVLPRCTLSISYTFNSVLQS